MSRNWPRECFLALAYACTLGELGCGDRGRPVGSGSGSGSESETTAGPDEGECVAWGEPLATPSLDIAQGVAVGMNGDVYISGYSEGDLNGHANTGVHAMFAAKFSPEGSISWTSHFGTAGIERGHAIAVANDGAVHVAGVTTAVSSPAAYVVKYDEDGSELWLREFNISDWDTAEGIAVAAAGEVYVSGTTLAGPGATFNAFVRKFSGDGELLWTRQISTSSDDYGHRVAVSVSGSVYLGGATFGELDSEQVSDNQDFFIAKLDSDGSQEWARQFGGDDSDALGGLAVNEEGDILVSGSTTGEFDGNPHHGSYDVFVAKVSSTGELGWTRQLGTSESDESPDLEINELGEIYVAGRTGGAMAGNSNAGSMDAFLTKFSPDGLALWTRQFGTSDMDAGTNIALGPDGRVFVTGYSYGAFNGEVGTDDASILLALCDP